MTGSIEHIGEAQRFQPVLGIHSVIDGQMTLEGPKRDIGEVRKGDTVAVEVNLEDMDSSAVITVDDASLDSIGTQALNAVHLQESEAEREALNTLNKGIINEGRIHGLAGWLSGVVFGGGTILAVENWNELFSDKATAGMMLTAVGAMGGIVVTVGEAFFADEHKKNLKALRTGTRREYVFDRLRKTSSTETN